ncbi:MAG: amidohydrolase family protein [Pyrinomonadaceae bacterium]
MKNLLAFLLIILLPILLIAQTNPVNQTFVLTHVTVIDLTGTPPKSDMTVVITDNRIVALGRSGVVSVPQNARIIDATGKFLIPGLWDMHTHTNWNRKSREVEEQFFPLFIANGVTGIREMGSLFSIERFNRWRAASAADKLLAPRIVVGKMVAGPGDSSLAIAVRDEREAREAVRRVKREGYDFVKVHDKLSGERFLAIADEARRQSLPLAGHVPLDMNPVDASDAGMNSIEHLSGMITAGSNREDELRREEIEFGERLAGLQGRALYLEEVRLGISLLDTYSEEKAARLLPRFVQNNTWLCPTLTIHRPYALVTDPSIYNDRASTTSQPIEGEETRLIGMAYVIDPQSKLPRGAEVIKYVCSR